MSEHAEFLRFFFCFVLFAFGLRVLFVFESWIDWGWATAGVYFILQSLGAFVASKR